MKYKFLKNTIFLLKPQIKRKYKEDNYKVPLEDLGWIETKKMVLQSLYIWRVAWNSLPISNFSEFLELCSSFSMI
jgi:hypothetical protein